MRVSLLENVTSLGPKGATVDVPDGYAINFLFPQHLAVKVTAEALTDKEELKNLKNVKREPISADQALAADLDGLEVIIPVRAKGDKLLAPITATEIRAALKDLGYKLPKSAIHTKPLVAIGVAEVPVVFDSGFEAIVQVVLEAAP